MLAAKNIFGEIKPETVDRQTFVRIMQLRDLRQCPHELTLRILKRTQDEFGINAQQRPVFVYPFCEKQIYLYFLKQRSRKQHRQQKNSLNKHSETTSLLETNLDILAKEQFFLYLSEYESVTKSEKIQRMKNYIAELKYWQTVYIDYLQSLDQPVPNMAELWEEYQKTIERFKAGADPQTAVRIDSFVHTLNRHLIADGVHDAVEKIFPKIMLQKTMLQKFWNQKKP